MLSWPTLWLNLLTVYILGQRPKSGIAERMAKNNF